MGGFAESIAVHDLCAAAPDGTMAVRTGPGLGVDVVATPHTLDALVEALVEWAEHRGVPGNRR